MVDSREREENDEDHTGRNGWLIAIEVIAIHPPVKWVLTASEYCDIMGVRGFICDLTVTSATRAVLMSLGSCPTRSRLPLKGPIQDFL